MKRVWGGSCSWWAWRKFQSQTGAGPHWAEWSFNASTSAVPVFSAAVDTVGWQPDALVYSTAADSSAEQWWSEGDDTWDPTADVAWRGDDPGVHR